MSCKGATPSAQLCLSDLYTCLKRRLHMNYLELKVVFLALKEFQDLHSNKVILIVTDTTTVIAYINKEGGMRSGPLCALLTWYSRKQVALKEGLTHSRLAECGGRQAIQAEPDISDRMVSPSRGFSVDMYQVAPTKNRPFCNQVQQVAPVCVTAPRLPRLGSRCT